MSWFIFNFIFHCPFEVEITSKSASPIVTLACKVNFDFFDGHLSPQCHLYQCPYNVVVGWDLILGSCLSWVVLRLMRPCKVDIYHQKMENRELSAKNLFPSIEIFSPILWRRLVFLCLFVLYSRIFVTHISLNLYLISYFNASTFHYVTNFKQVTIH